MSSIITQPITFPTKTRAQPLPRMLAADEVIPTIQRIIAIRTAAYNSVSLNVTTETATFENVIQPLLEDEDINQGTEAVIDMYRYAGPDQESRDAAEEATRLMSECNAQLKLRSDLFLLVKAVADRDDYPNEECAKAVRDMLRGFTNVGHGKLTPDKIQKLLDVRKEIDRLCQDFNRNLREHTEGAWFTLTELEGLPAQEIQHLTAKSKRQDQVYIDYGKRADRLLVLRHARNPATRKKLYLGNEKKLPENISIFKRVVLLRHETAHLLGFKSHAEFKLQERIATSTEWVYDMLQRMRDQLLPVGQRALEQLKALKRELVTSTQAGDDEIFPWDFHYYMRLLEDEKRVDQELISQYFPLRNTVLRMLGLFGSFLQLRFVPIVPEELTGRVWHEDVEAWSVWDDRTEHTSEFVGYLFSDILYRDGKYKGNQNVNLQASYLKPNGGRVFPATILMCNFSPSPITGCALLRHSEVVTLFHELGHGIHDLLSRTFHTRYHAWRAPAEFAEALSMMLENWCWNMSDLKELSCHYSRVDPHCLQAWRAQHPGATLPAERIQDEVLEQLIASRNLNKAFGLLQQTFLNENSAQIFAADFYETVLALNPQSRASWSRYRQVILEAGGSRDELKMMEEFLGRHPKVDALVRSLALS
ncbi:hypothetical protein KVR01_008966 [Diaporthe batatas]|uniref:uncharacterized protein n=1 Tax=Diaporthe batatas TaxID=748121 RepID=UPI001D05018E|nr:uncharacterized protein KVR01_008966 [Diaporthe batatas]KAG8160702.1 hypothetical protein KVR01_008966 [Diaporthe batatas]